MLDPKVTSVVGIDVAKTSHVVCALETQFGKLLQRPRSIAAGTFQVQRHLPATGPTGVTSG